VVCFGLRLSALPQNSASLRRGADRGHGRPAVGDRARRRSKLDGYAGLFSLATAVEGHRAGTLVQVIVSARHPSRLVLHFSDHHQVVTDACVLLCGHIGALVLLELGYSGPLARRPQMAASARLNASRRADAELRRNLMPRKQGTL
jgi:hypothetical protein